MIRGVLVLFNILCVWTGRTPSLNESPSESNNERLLVSFINADCSIFRDGEDLVMTTISNKSFHEIYSKEMFHNCIYKVIKEMYNIPNYVVFAQGLPVIDDIYNAAVLHNASVHEVICFTSIAMFNTSYFCEFNKYDVNDKYCENGKRGLLQFKNCEQYSRLSLISEIDYFNMPYLLNLYSSKTIFDEFNEFIVSYYNPRIRNNIECYVSAIKDVGYPDSNLISSVIAQEVMKGTFCPKNNDESEVEQRIKVYFLLTGYLLKENIKHLLKAEN